MQERRRGIDTQVACPACSARGFVMVDPYIGRELGSEETGIVTGPRLVDCDKCGGDGRFTIGHCDRCHGTGKVLAPQPAAATVALLEHATGDEDWLTYVLRRREGLWQSGSFQDAVRAVRLLGARYGPGAHDLVWQVAVEGREVVTDRQAAAFLAGLEIAAACLPARVRVPVWARDAERQAARRPWLWRARTPAAVAARADRDREIVRLYREQRVGVPWLSREFGLSRSQVYAIVAVDHAQQQAGASSGVAA